MLHLFLKSTEINQAEWSIVYQKIASLTAAFPLKLVRIEAYNGFSPELDKEHFDLFVKPGTDEEHLSFFGDRTSFTDGTNIKFYKNWQKHIENALETNSEVKAKPITWFPHKPFKDDGSAPDANGASTKYGYIDTRGALYIYAVLAIGILLENELPGRAFLIADEPEPEDIQKVVEWLEAHFQERFDGPIYFDKKRLIASIIHEYDDLKEVVCRLEHLFRKQFKRNMSFAIEHIGYEPAFEFYAEVLEDCRFGTFGFSDVMDAWIAASQDLESTLELIAESKRLLLKAGKQPQADEYDLTFILKSLLKAHVLWTPLQREQLAPFYTNQQALETGSEGLFGSIMRMTGYRVEVCPIYATQDELFEAFMYHDPKNGAVFKKIIDDWLEKNADAFEKMVQKIAEIEQKKPDLPGQEAEEEAGRAFEQETFLWRYPSHERFFIEQALTVNPDFDRLEQHIETVCKNLWETSQEAKHQKAVQQIKSETADEKRAIIRRQIKDLRLGIHPDFEKWMREEDDQSVLFFIRLLLSLKITYRQRAFARHQILWEPVHWERWRTGNVFAV